MADSKRYKDWFDKAEAEFESAEILMNNNGNNAVCFSLSTDPHGRYSAKYT
jgi:HEPN domain-containing protein